MMLSIVFHCLSSSRTCCKFHVCVLEQCFIIGIYGNSVIPTGWIQELDRGVGGKRKLGRESESRIDTNV